MSEINSIKSAQAPQAVKKVTDTESNAVTAKQANIAEKASSVESTDKVTLSGSFEKLKLQVKLQPIVNEDRVAHIKNAVEGGSYTVDSQELAQKMLKFEGDL